MASSKSGYSAPVLPLACFTSSSLSPNRLGYSSVNFDIARSVSPTRNPQPHSPVRSVPAKGGQRKPVPSASGRQMCLCSPTNHPAAYAKIGDEEFVGEDRKRGRRRMGEQGPHPPLFSPSAKEKYVFPAAAQQAPPHDHGGRFYRFLNREPENRFSTVCKGFGHWREWMEI
ncbi:hypothetical protein KI387_043744 [Taxus chinensis]|uniref:Uncharacterized protein n=1 Tax=Taxus chinensis TaxID=29808 RepID=A0AA38GWJ3_TAXCH|nr:hypothetical protein KI387_043744 [Taxus chinensis]